MTAPLLDPMLMARLERLRVVSRRLVRGTHAGERHSRQLGSSLEFADFRPYFPGDDIRQVDWHAYARLGRWFLKMFLDERETALHLFIDASRSMAFGRPAKGRVAVELAASLGVIALSHMDRVGAALFRERVEDRLPLQRGKAGIHRLFSFLNTARFHGRGDLNGALSAPSALPRRPGIAVVLTDAFYENGVEAGLARLQAARQQVCLIHLTAGEEREPDWSGDLRLIDSETGNRREVSLSPHLLKRYRKALAEYVHSLKLWCFRRGIAYIPVSAEDPLETILFTLLRRAGLIR